MQEAAGWEGDGGAAGDGDGDQAVTPRTGSAK